MNRSGFLKGAMILTMAGIIVKIIGAINKIFISRILGGEGVGIYQMAYSMFNMVASLATIGIPIALSIVIADRLAKQDMNGVRKVYHIALITIISTSVLGAILLYTSSEWLYTMGIIYDHRAVMALKVVAFAVPFMSVMALYRGYFQGFQHMFPIGISQIIEQIIRVGAMTGLAVYFLKQGLAYATMGATFANFPASVGAALALLYFYVKQRRQVSTEQRYMNSYSSIHKNRVTTSEKKRIFASAIMTDRDELTYKSLANMPTYIILKRLVWLALPILIVPILIPFTAAIDAVIVPNRLAQAGLVGKEITAAFGYLTGMANSLVNLPVILTLALATSLVPAISEANSTQNMEKIVDRTRTTMKIANLVTLPAAIGMIVLATPISLMLYATPKAGAPLAFLSFSMVFLGWQQITTSVLQGLGRTGLPTINLAIGMVVKISLTWYLTAMPSLQTEGAALATIIGFAVAFILNVIYVYRYTPYRIDSIELGKILLSACIMGVGTYFVYEVLYGLLGNTLTVLVAILVATLLYIISLILLRAVTQEDLFTFPIIGSRMRRRFEK